MKRWCGEKGCRQAGSPVGLHRSRSSVGSSCFSVVNHTKWRSHPFIFSKILFCQCECAFINRSNEVFCCVIRGIHRVENYSRLGLDTVLLDNLLLTLQWSLLPSVFRKRNLLGIIGYYFPMLCTPSYRVTCSF
jgi:hypothetical protein